MASSRYPSDAERVFVSYSNPGGPVRHARFTLTSAVTVPRVVRRSGAAIGGDSRGERYDPYFFALSPCALNSKKKLHENKPTALPSLSSARWGSSQRFCRLRDYLAVIFPFCTLVRSTEWYSLFISFAAEGSRNGSSSRACLGIRRRLHDCVRMPIPNIFYVVPSGPVVGLLVGVVANQWLT